MLPAASMGASPLSSARRICLGRRAGSVCARAGVSMLPELGTCARAALKAAAASKGRGTARTATRVMATSIRCIACGRLSRGAAPTPMTRPGNATAGAASPSTRAGWTSPASSPTWGLNHLPIIPLIGSTTTALTAQRTVDGQLPRSRLPTGARCHATTAAESPKGSGTLANEGCDCWVISRPANRERSGRRPIQPV